MKPKNPNTRHKWQHHLVLSGPILPVKMMNIGAVLIFISCFSMDGLYSRTAHALETKVTTIKVGQEGEVREDGSRWLHYPQMRDDGKDESGNNTVFFETEEISGKTVSKYGEHIKNIFKEFSVERGYTWDVWHDGSVDYDWIAQHPPIEYLGKSSSKLPVPETCDCGDDCNTEFHLKTCKSDDDCKRKKFCPVQRNSGPNWKCPEEVKMSEYFEPGMCKHLDSTKKSVGSKKHGLCVGHSFELYEQMFNHIIQARHFVDITSLDSFDTIGYKHSSGKEFTAVIRNAISYLASTGRKVTVRIHFGSIYGFNEDVNHIMNNLWPKNISQNKMDLHVTTYRIEGNTWNHGKILAVDGNSLFMGGTNYYTEHYLMEDPVFDVNLRIQGSAAVTAHKWANKLHKAACEFSADMAGLDHVGYAWKSYDNKERNDGTKGCPPAYNSKTHRKIHRNLVGQSKRSKKSKKSHYESTTFTVIPTARMGGLAGTAGIQKGEKTSDLAMYSMITNAEKSIKISQQDMLPVMLYGPVSKLYGDQGYTVGVASSTGLPEFDDTWRLMEALAIAISKNVKVSIMLSAPCSTGGSPPHSLESDLGSTEKCPEDGTQGKGHDYWARVYRHNGNKWPAKRPIDKKRLFIDTSQKVEVSQLDQRRLSEGGYGYGWSLDNTADWIYAYFSIFKEKRPKDPLTHNPISDGQVVNLICRLTEIGHTRLTKEEETYMRISKNHKFRGGQVGNHAKVVIVDDSIFYVGSDNMYGAGLAEFGLVVDDKKQTKQFVADYFETHWNEVLGTKEIPGLVTGGSRLTYGCPWKTRLPTRPKPWSDINLDLAYGDKAYLNLVANKEKWLTNHGSVKALDVHKHKKKLNTFQWIFRSHLGDGLRLSRDPIQGTCVKYGDKVFLQANNEDRKWLLGGQGSDKSQVLLRDKHFGSNCDYQWIVRSHPADNVDRHEGKCVSEKGLVYLQVNDAAKKLLTVGSSHAVYGKDCHGGPNSKWKVEMSADNLGQPCSWDEDCDSGRCSSNYICEPLLPNGEFCLMNDDCISQRCDSSAFNVLHRSCQSKAGEFSSCNENSDCQNDECTWGFICGEACSRHNQCKSTGRCSFKYTCEKKLEDGAQCVYNQDCISDDCAIPQFKCGAGCLLDKHCDEKTESCSFDLVCLPKKENGAVCVENDDCKSGGCSWAFTCGKTCTLDTQCDTGRCSKWLICEPKLPNGGWCGEGDDCLSGHCNPLFACAPKSKEGEICVNNCDCAEGGCSWAFTCGNSCFLDSECDTGRCSNNLICEPKLPNGQYCGEDDDCQSGRCDNLLRCSAKGKEGEICTENDDCAVGKCSWALTCGNTCTRDSQCSTGRCSKNLICEPKLPNGKSCGEDDDCQSGRCDNTFRCSKKGKEGETCTENDDCAVGKCSWAFTCGNTCTCDSQCSTGRCSNNLICEPKLPNGKSCGEDDDCHSGRCDKWFQCRPKLGSGEYCGQHDDCVSNSCNWGWCGWLWVMQCN